MKINKNKITLKLEKKIDLISVKEEKKVSEDIKRSVRSFLWDFGSIVGFGNEFLCWYNAKTIIL